MSPSYTYWCFEQSKLESTLKEWAVQFGGPDRQQQAIALVLDFMHSQASLEQGLRKVVVPGETL